MQSERLQAGHGGATPGGAVGDDAVDAANTVEMQTRAIRQDEPDFGGQVVTAPGTSARLGPSAVKPVPGKDEFAEGEPFGLFPPAIIVAPMNNPRREAVAQPGSVRPSIRDAVPGERCG